MKNILFLIFIFISFSLQSQIIFDITDNGVGGINIVASGSAVVPQKQPQAFQLGVTYDCNFQDEDFQDFCLNGIQTTINGMSWPTNISSYFQGDGSSTLIFNGFLLNRLFMTGGFFHFAGAGVIPGSDGINPISASGSMNLNIPFTELPMSPQQPGEITTIDLFGEGLILFRFINTEPIPTLSQWGIIALGMLTMIFGVVTLKYATRFRLQGK